MNTDIVKGKWHEMKGKVRQQWGELTDNEVTQMKGSHEELTGILQKKYGYKKEKAEQEIKQFIDKNNWNEE